MYEARTPWKALLILGKLSLWNKVNWNRDWVCTLHWLFAVGTYFLLVIYRAWENTLNQQTFSFSRKTTNINTNTCRAVVSKMYKSSTKTPTSISADLRVSPLSLPPRSQSLSPGPSCLPLLWVKTTEGRVNGSLDPITITTSIITTSTPQDTDITTLESIKAIS